MRWSLIGLTAVVVQAAACSNVATQPNDSAVVAQWVEIGDTIRLQPGATAQVRGTEIQVTFRRVEADSRCPIDALCVWPGDAQVRLELSTGGRGSTPASLHSFTEPREFEFEGHVFRLIELTPAPVSTRQTSHDEYRLGLEVTPR